MMTVPNWVVGPSYVVAMVLMCALRLRPEEKLMRDEFNGEYEAYASRTNRLIPGVWYVRPGTSVTDQSGDMGNS